MKYFLLLKEALSASFRQAYPECTRPIEEWKGQEIVNFQEELQRKVKGRISEKWFYTHMKSRETQKLPRIDILNMLSEYAGYRSWNEFTHQHIPEAGQKSQNDQQIRAVPNSRFSVRLAGIGLIAVLGAGMIWMMLSGRVNGNLLGSGVYTFCFVDANTGKPITDQSIALTFFPEGETPVSESCDPKGCYSWKGKAGKLFFEVKAPYYKPDTIIRVWNGSPGQETVPLKTDDYALMIHLFSTGNLKDWKKRRKQLDQMIADEAVIFQVFSDGTRGLAMYNKQEFIDRMTMPIKSLRDIEILETLYDNRGKVQTMRFIQETEKMKIEFIIIKYIWLPIWLVTGLGPILAQEAQTQSIEKMAPSRSVALPSVYQKMEGDFVAGHLDATRLSDFEEQAYQKLEDFAGYHAVVANQEYDEELGNHALDLALNLFDSQESRIKFVQASGPTQEMTIRDFMQRSRKEGWQLNVAEMDFISPFAWNAKDNQYQGMIRARISFPHTEEAQSIQQVEVILRRREKAFGKQTKRVWEVFLGNFGV